MYVDHAATTPVRPEVLAAMLPYFAERWGNPSSLHGPGRAAKQGLDRARQTVADTLGCRPEEVVFTASGSEGANLAVKGVASAAPAGRTHLVTSRIEHHAVLDACRSLAQRHGFEVTELDVDGEGLVDLAQLEQAVTDRTALVSVMYANNEVGTIQPIADVARVAHARGALVHTDAVQAAGTLSLDVDALGVDLLSVAGHKVYGPKGVGALYVRRGTRLWPQVHGGGQERGRRGGTEDVPSVVGLAEALALAQAERAPTEAPLRALTGRLLAELPARVPGCRATGHASRRLAGLASFAFEGVESAPLVLALDRQGIYASSGSACSASSAEPSHVLRAMGVPRTHLFGALRLSLGRDNDEADVAALLEAIPATVAQLRASCRQAS